MSATPPTCHNYNSSQTFSDDPTNRMFLINYISFSGVYKKRRYGYNDVVKIPAGAASVQILQRGYRNKVADGNYLAIKDWTGTYLLNGGYTLSTYQKDISVNGEILAIFTQHLR